MGYKEKLGNEQMRSCHIDLFVRDFCEGSFSLYMFEKLSLDKHFAKESQKMNVQRAHETESRVSSWIQKSKGIGYLEFQAGTDDGTDSLTPQHVMLFL